MCDCTHQTTDSEGCGLLAEALSALAAAGGTTLVKAMIADGWAATKIEFARLLGRGDASREKAAADKLEQTRAEVAAAGDEQAMVAARAAWAARLADLLEDQPEVADQLQALVDQINGHGSAGSVSQRVLAVDNAQVAVQGHGSQVNTFGGASAPRSRNE
jgi:hypothetical protein